MSVVADRVIVELEAKLDRYEANVRRAEQKFNAATRAIEADGKRLEKSISGNSTVIGNQLKGLAGALGAAFTASQVVSLTDSYTRFTNQLKVAGLEGEQLAKIQQTLFDIAQKNGTPLESLASLYQRAGTAAKDLGASQADIIQTIEGVAAALRVQGASTAQADQAILGFVQALGTGIVHAEEFNQVNDAAPSIMRAVAKNIDAAGGSVGKLRTLIVGGKISSAEFFQAFLKGSKDLQEQSLRTNLTISASFQILENALTRYVGEAGQASGSTTIISGAIVTLAENLDTVTNAVAVLAAVLLGRFAAGMVAGASSTGLASAAIFALEARAVGAATTVEALGFAGAAAGRTLLAAFGGPIGIAVTALTLGIGYLASSSAEAEAASSDLAASIDAQAKQYGLAQNNIRQANAETDNLTSTERAALVATANLTGEAYKLADAWARVAASAKAARIEQAKTDLDKAQRNRKEADAALEADKSKGTFFGLFRTSSAGADPNPALVSQSFRAQKNEQAAQADLAKIQNEPLVDFKPQPIGGGAPTGKTKKGKKGPKATDPAVAARRFADDLARGQQELLQSQAELKGTQDARREAERGGIEIERQITARSINADKDLSAAQKAQLLALNDAIAATKQESLDAQEREQHHAEFLQLQGADIENERDLLDARQGLARSSKARLDIALRLLDLEKQEEKLRLEAIIASSQSTEIEKRIARDRLAGLDARYGLRKQGVEKQNQGPLQDWVDQFGKTPDEVRDQIEGLITDELDSVRDGINNALTKALGVKDPLIAGLLKLLLDKILFEPIARALNESSSGAGGGGGGGGGFLSGLINSAVSFFSGKGRASGGHVIGGHTYRVNEGGGIEGFQPAGSGKIIPLGRMRTAGNGGMALYQTVHVDARGSVNPDGYAEHIREVVRKDTISIVGEGMRRVNRGTPSRMRQFERDGR